MGLYVVYEYSYHSDEIDIYGVFEWYKDADNFLKTHEYSKDLDIVRFSLSVKIETKFCDHEFTTGFYKEILPVSSEDIEFFYALLNLYELISDKFETRLLTQLVEEFHSRLLALELTKQPGVSE